MASQQNFPIFVFLCIAILHCHSGQSDAATLPDSEIELLKIIGQKLGKGDWDFNRDPCVLDPDGLKCDCSYVKNTVCHVTNMYVFDTPAWSMSLLFGVQKFHFLTVEGFGCRTLKGQNLGGVLPPELGNLKSLEELDLASNRINGSIPPQLGSLASLKILSLSSNLLSGPVPKELGNLSKLVELKIDSNYLSGKIPQEIWNLTSLEKLNLSYNQFIGEIFPTKAILQNLLEFWASSNNFTGKIPGVIENFVNLEKLLLEGTSLEGPIPSNISSLIALEDLRISDILQGENSSLNFILSLKNLRILVLRNNFITAKIPDRLVTLSKLRILDLSFNNLSGPIPQSLPALDKLFLRKNSLTGPLPSWLSSISSTEIIDLSYNNLSGDIDSDLLNNKNVNLTWNSLNPPPNHRNELVCPQRNSLCSNEESKSKTVMIVIIVVIVIVILAILLVLYIVFNKRRKKGESICSCLHEDKEMKTIEGNYFSLRIMKIATKNFDPKNKIGEGGFGVVYKGILPDGRKAAIKQLSSQSKQGNREFLNEVGTISAVQHPYLVKLYGCCVEEELLLVYEYVENGNLAQALFGPGESRVKLDWPTRYKICIGVARGLAHLHEESLLKIVHRDIKSTNILLDKDLNPKVADFGLARLFDEEITHVSTRVAGTIGYMAPEYALKGHLTDKADVYSFGVVVLEIVSGRTHTDTKLEEERAYLLEWAWKLYEEKKMLKLVDMYLLHSGYNEEEVVRMIYVGLLCTHENPGRRPSMSAVVDMLEGRIGTPAPQSRPGYLNHWQTWQLVAGVQHQQTQSSTSKSSALQGPWEGSFSNSKEDSHSL